MCIVSPHTFSFSPHTQHHISTYSLLSFTLALTLPYLFLLKSTATAEAAVAAAVAATVAVAAALVAAVGVVIVWAVSARACEVFTGT